VADIKGNMNPLELQVLSIVCGVTGTTQNAPVSDSIVQRQPVAIVLPPRSLPSPRTITRA
jgi:hypothetical protein